MLTLSLCAVAALLEGFDTQSMGVVAPWVIEDFHLSPSTAGWIFSVATLGLFLGAALGGRFADVIGRKKTLVVSLFAFGFFSLISAAATTATSLAVARALTGLGLGGAMPNFIALSSESAERANRISVVTLIMAAMPLGGSIAAVLALGAQLGWSWRSIFVIGGVSPVILAIAMIFLLQDTRVPRPGPSVNVAVPVASAAHALFGGGRRSATLLLWLAFFFTQLVLLLMLNWLPSLVIGLGFSRAQATLAAVCFGFSGSVGAIWLGRMHAGGSRRLWVVLTYIGIVFALGALVLGGASFLIIASACACAGIFIIGAQLVLFAFAPLYYSFSIRGTGVGASVAIGRLGSAIGPLFAGSLLASGRGSASVLVAIIPFVLIAGTAAYFLASKSDVLR